MPEPSPRALLLRASLLDVRPEVWRRLRVPETLTLADLHRVLQIAMGWEETHLHRFGIGGGYLAEGSGRARLAELGLRPGETLFYEYDFGDQWEHEVVVEEILGPDPKNARPACTGGSRACPPEDCGGPWMYMERLRARKNRQRAGLGRGFDPARFVRGPVNAELKRMTLDG